MGEQLVIKVYHTFLSKKRKTVFNTEYSRLFYMSSIFDLPLFPWNSDIKDLI